MLLTKSSPGQVFGWFYEEDVDHDLLLFLIDTDIKTNDFGQFLREELYKLDTILGSRIGFLQFLPNSDQATSFRIRDSIRGVFSGAFNSFCRDSIVSDHPVPMELVVRGLEPLSLTEGPHAEEIADLAAKHSKTHIPELVGKFEIAIEEIPCLLILTKFSNDFFIIPLNDSYEFSELFTLLEKISKVLKNTEVDNKFYRTSLPRLTKAVMDLNQHERRFEELKTTIIHAIEGLAWHQDGSVKDREYILRFVDQKDFTSSSVSKLFSKLSFEIDYEDKRVETVREISKKITKIEDAIERTISDVEFQHSIAPVLEERAKRADKVLNALTELSKKQKTYRRTLSRGYKLDHLSPTYTADFVNRWAALSERIWKALSFLPGAG